MQGTRLTLEQLDSIYYMYEDMQRIVDPIVFERTEQILLYDFIKPHFRVLDMGGWCGLANCVVNNRLADQTHHVVIEPSEKSQDALRFNRDTHNAKFHIFKGIVSKESGELSGECMCRTVNSSKSGNIVNKTVKELEEEYGFTFNALVADCEGFLEHFVRDFPEFFDQIEFAFFEKDCADKCNYNYIEDFLRSKNFVCKLNGFHSIWEKST